MDQTGRRVARLGHVTTASRARYASASTLAAPATPPYITSMVPRIALIVMLITSTISADARRRAVASRPGWDTPRCEEVRGFPAVSVSLDGGRSVLTHDEGIEGLQVYTFGLAALKRPNRMLAITGRALLASSDSGCSWQVDGRFTFPQTIYAFTNAGDAGVWAWSRVTPELFRFDNDGELRAQQVAPVLLPIAFHVEASDTRRLATADDQGQIWWSDDEGASWQLHAVVPVQARLNALEFSPRGRSHAIAAALVDGAQVTLDAGATWTPSSGLEGLNVFRFAFSPVDPDVVWAIAINPTVKGIGRRAIYHSSDGGRSFRSVVTGSETYAMTNGFTMAPSPVDASLLYFALPGTFVFLIDDAGTLQRSAELPHRDINSIVFSPASPRVMYFGLKLSEMTAD